jgi:hypothetical protein
VRTSTLSLSLVLVGAVTFLATGSATANAAPTAPVTAQESRAMLRASDLSLHYAHVTRASSEDLGDRRRPTACENPLNGTLAAPKKAAQQALLKELAFPAGIVWQNTAFFYPSARAAMTAFGQMADTAIAKCNLSKVINIGTDEDVVKARVTLRSRMLPAQAGVTRLAVDYGTSLVSSPTVNQVYADSYEYSVYALKSNVITRVGVVQIAPVELVEYTDADAAAVRVAERLARLGE